MLPAQTLLCHGLPPAPCHQIPSLLHCPAGHRDGPGYSEHSPGFLGMGSTSQTSQRAQLWMPQGTWPSSFLEESGQMKPLGGSCTQPEPRQRGRTPEILQKRDTPKSPRFLEIFPSQPETGAPSPLLERDSHARAAPHRHPAVPPRLSRARSVRRGPGWGHPASLRSRNSLPLPAARR